MPASLATRRAQQGFVRGVRRLQLDPGGASRAVSGIAVAVAGAIALQMVFTGGASIVTALIGLSRLLTALEQIRERRAVAWRRRARRPPQLGAGQRATQDLSRFNFDFGGGSVGGVSVNGKSAALRRRGPPATAQAKAAPVRPERR